ncbi:MAG TPA: phosphorylase [Polyangia bacterium]|nr:phosphorylase [Polyangia bacterium]
MGVGAVDAGIATARLLARARPRPRRLLFVGTAGAYGATPAIDSAVVVARACLVSTAAVRGDGYLPAPVATELHADAALARGLALLAPGGATAACPLAITRGAALARRIAAANGAAVENLELFAVGRAAAAAGVPFAAVVGVANRVGPRAHAEWKRHHESASAAACAVIAAWLAG